MANKKSRLRYLPLFEQDLVQTVSYITNVLKNPPTDKIKSAIKIIADFQNNAQAHMPA